MSDEVIEPFSAGQSMTIGGLTIESSTSSIAIYGDIDLNADRQGLEAAQRLKATIDAIVAKLEAVPELPNTASPLASTGHLKNPFQ